MIDLEHQDSVAVIRLNDSKVNLLNLELLSELDQTLAALESSAEVTALVLTGAGSCFSAGVDLYRILNDGRDYIESFMRMLVDVPLRLFTFPKPVVAAVNGHAIAGGCILTCACDYRIMATGGGRIGIPELLVGVPFPSLPLEIMRHTVPPHSLQKLVYTGKTCLASEARETGLVDEVTEPNDLLETAHKMARRLGSIPGQSFRLTKQAMRQPVIDRFERYRKTQDVQALEAWSSPEIHEVIRIYLEKTIGKK